MSHCTSPRLVLEHQVERRVGDQAAVPVMGAIDLDCRKAGGQGTARHDVLRDDVPVLAVEVAKIALLHIDRADRKANAPLVD